MHITFKDVGIFLITAAAGFLIVAFLRGFLESLFNVQISGMVSLVAYVIFVVWSVYVSTRKTVK